MVRWLVHQWKSGQLVDASGQRLFRIVYAGLGVQRPGTNLLRPTAIRDGDPMATGGGVEGRNTEELLG
jgi:hypothetical protein